MDNLEPWTTARAASAEIRKRFAAEVSAVELSDYTDSMDRPSVRVTVWLRDKADESDYEWVSELKPIEVEIARRIAAIFPERLVYTHYVLESERAERAKYAS